MQPFDSLSDHDAFNCYPFLALKFAICTYFWIFFFFFFWILAFVLMHESRSNKMQYRQQCHHQQWLLLLFPFFFLFININIIIIFLLFYRWQKILFSFLLFVWLLVDFVRVWRFGFEFERWDFVMVFGLILACVHNGSVGWVMVMVVVRLLFFGWVNFGLGFVVVPSGWVSIWWVRRNGREKEKNNKCIVFQWYVSSNNNLQCLNIENCGLKKSMFGRSVWSSVFKSHVSI